MLKKRYKEFFPIVLLFVVLNALFISGRPWLQRANINQDVLIVGNLLLFVITTVSFLLAKRGLKNPNPHAFVRSVYGSMMIKLFICIAIAFIYIAAFKGQLNKPALFTCMGIYLVYTFLEVSALMKLLKGRS